MLCDEILSKKDFEIKTLEIESFQRRLTTKNIKAISVLKKAFKEAKNILKEERHDVVIGTGGYVCWPVIKAAQRLKIPTVLHESNYSPGLATKTLASKCNKVLLHFSQSESEFKRKNNLVTVGNPIPDAFHTVTRQEARKKLGLSTKDFLVLL